MCHPFQYEAAAQSSCKYILHFLDVIDGNKHKTKQNEPNLLFVLEKQ